MSRRKGGSAFFGSSNTGEKGGSFFCFGGFGASTDFGVPVGFIF